MFSWFSSSSKASNDDDTDLNKSKAEVTDTKSKKDTPVDKGKPRRVSRSWLQSPVSGTGSGENNLEGKTAQHDLLNKTDSTMDPMASSSILSTGTSKRFEMYLEPHRISSRPLHIVRQSDSDILLFKEDHFEREKRENRGKFITIPILPADEMNSLTSEIKLWHKNRKSFKLIFTIAMICGFTVLAISLIFTATWYAQKDLSLLHLHTNHFSRPATQQYNIHMNIQVVNLLLMATGLNTFRLLPQTKLTKVINYHIIILSVSFALGIVGLLTAVHYHEKFTHITFHFYSLHSWIGLTSVIFYLYCLFSGFFLLYYPSNRVKESHSRFAILTFMLCGAAAIAGFFYRSILQIGAFYGHVSTPGIIANSIGLLIVVFCIFVRLAIASFVYRRRPKPQWDVIVYRSMEVIEDVYLEIHDMYDSFEMWMKQVNQARLKALRVPQTSVRSSFADSEKSAGKSDDINV